MTSAPEGSPFVIRQVRLGCLPAALALVAGAVIVVLTVLFSVVFLALFAVLGAGLAIRLWWSRRRMRKFAADDVFEAEYEIVEPERQSTRKLEISTDRETVDEVSRRPDQQ